jgi:hypothetical protein
MRLKLGKFPGWAVVGMLLMLAGCGTITPVQHENPYFGYVYCEMMLAENQKVDFAAFDRALRGYKKAIADDRLTRMKAARPADDEKRISERSKYVQLLDTPIQLKREQWEEGAKALNEKERRRLLSFWDRSADKMVFSASEFSLLWEREMADARLRLSELERERETALRKLEGFRRDNRFFDAIDILPLIKTFGVVGRLETEVRSDAVTYWLGEVNNALSGAMSLSGAAREEVLAKTYTDLLRYREKSGWADRFSQVLNETVTLLGDNWRERIELKGQAKDFWGAYLLAREKLAVARKDYAPYMESLIENMSRGYVDVLKRSLRHYLGRANKSFSEDLYGVAYVSCCMALEMTDFLPMAGLQPDADILQLRANVETLIEDSEQRVEDYLSRKLVIRDFDFDQRGMAKKVRAAAARRYEVPGNDLVWAVSVAPDEDETARDRDYELSGIVSDYTVERIPEVFSPMQSYERGTESMQLVSNPNYKQKGLPFSESKLIWQQRVDLYPVNIVAARKKISVDLSASCAYKGNVAQEVFVLRREMADAELKSKIEGRFKQYGQPSPSPQFRLNSEKDKLIVDPLPQNERDNLSGDSEINREMDTLIVDGILEGMDRVFFAYPVELLNDSRSLRESAESRCDRLGLFLMYCEQLSGSEISSHPLASSGLVWLHKKDVIQKNIEAWLEKRWNVSGDTKQEISHLWDECLNAVKALGE